WASAQAFLERGRWPHGLPERRYGSIHPDVRTPRSICGWPAEWTGASARSAHWLRRHNGRCGGRPVPPPLRDGTRAPERGMVARYAGKSVSAASERHGNPAVTSIHALGVESFGPSRRLSTRKWAVECGHWSTVNRAALAAGLASAREAVRFYAAERWLICR